MGRYRIAGVEIVQELLDPVLAGDGLVVDELELRDAPQTKAGSNLTAQERNRPLQAARRVAARPVVAERSEEHASVLQIRRHLNARDRDEPDARVVNVAREQLAELAADLVGDALWTGTLRHTT